MNAPEPVTRAELNTTINSAWISFIHFCYIQILNPSGRGFLSWSNPAALPGAGAQGDTIGISNGSRDTAAPASALSGAQQQNEAFVIIPASFYQAFAAL